MPVVRATRTVVVSAALVLLSACGGGEDEVDEALRSSASQPFSIIEHEGSEHVVGHGIALEVPEAWTDYEPERDSADGTTYEWAVGLPAETRPLPSGIQFSMGKDTTGARFDSLPESTREVAEQAPGYRLLDEGEADVPGAEDAAFLRIERDLRLDGETVRVEQVQLMLAMPGGQTSVLRFIAESGQWEEQMEGAYDSLVVAEES
jgi:hypothetical protein